VVALQASTPLATTPMTPVTTRISGACTFVDFGEFEAGTVFVRNDRLKMDFEICLDLRNYSDVTGDNPHQR